MAKKVQADVEVEEETGDVTLYKFKVTGGGHNLYGVNYNRGEAFWSDVDMRKKHVNVFEKVDERTMPAGEAEAFIIKENKKLELDKSKGEGDTSILAKMVAKQKGKEFKKTPTLKNPPKASNQETSQANIDGPQEEESEELADDEEFVEHEHEVEEEDEDTGEKVKVKKKVKLKKKKSK